MTGKQNGLAMIEMALVTLVVVWVVFGVMEFGRVLYLYEAVGFAANHAARHAAAHGSKSSAPADATIIRNLVQSYPGLGNATVTSTWNPDNKHGSTFTVAVSVEFIPAVPLVPGNNKKSLAATAVSLVN